MYRTRAMLVMVMVILWLVLPIIFIFSDLYTDPQIHTAEGHDYGDGNLGVKGMALFFHSHSCSAICKGLGLENFDLAPRETDEIRSSRIASKSQTMLRGHEVVCASPSESDRADHFENFFRNRCNSVDLTRSMSCTSSSSYQEMDDSRGTSILGEVRNVEISRATQQLLTGKPHDFLAILALAHSKIKQIAQFRSC
jgi:hypothetical protein